MSYSNNSDMSSLLSSETDGFLFTWNVKNINLGFCEVESPKFMAYNLYKSEWIMGLGALSTRNCPSFLNPYLRMTICSEERTFMDVPVIPTVTVITQNGKEFVLIEKDDFQSMGYGPFVRVFLFEEFTLCDETLVFNCHIRKPLHLGMVPFVRCLATTHIVSEKRCSLWTVRNFGNLLPDKQQKYTLFSTSSDSPKIEILGTLSKRFKFYTEIHVQSDEYIFIVGKISILTPKNDLKWPRNKSFYLEKVSSKSVFKFPFRIFRSCVLKDLHNGDLNLLCEFSFSTGEMFSKIHESNYLTKECSDLLKKRLILPTGNSALHSSSTETEKNATPDTEDASCSNEKKKQPQTLKEDLKKLYLQKNHCDVTFQIGTENFEAHKSILCSRSPVFSAMFDSDMKETVNKKVEIVDIEADILNRFLLFLYSESLEGLTWDRATKLLYAANKYQVESLKVECTSFLMSNISVANVCEALKLSDLYQNEKLRSSCQNLIFEHEAEIFSSKEWETLTVENPLLSAKTLQNHFAMKK